MSSNVQLIRVLRGNIKQALRQRQLDEAGKLLDRLKQEDPLAVQTRGFELEYLLDAKRAEEACALAKQLLALYPDSARIQFLAGRGYYQKKDYQTAARCFSESLHVTRRWNSQRWLGKTYTQMGRLDDAEALLLELAPRHDVVDLDLAWLYERRGRIERAIACVDAYLEKHPGAEFAVASRKRLLACTQDPGTLTEDVEMLLALDEEISGELLPAYIQGLLETGQSPKARRFIQERLDSFDARTAVSLGWICYHRQAFDLAMALFLKALPSNLSNVKLLSSLEVAARHCDRIDDLIASYETYAEFDQRLFGRRNSLRNRLAGKPNARSDD